MPSPHDFTEAAVANAFAAAGRPPPPDRRLRRLAAALSYSSDADTALGLARHDGAHDLVNDLILWQAAQAARADPLRQAARQLIEAEERDRWARSADQEADALERAAARTATVWDTGRARTIRLQAQLQRACAGSRRDEAAALRRSAAELAATAG